MNAASESKYNDFGQIYGLICDGKKLLHGNYGCGETRLFRTRFKILFATHKKRLADEHGLYYIMLLYMWLPNLHVVSCYLSPIVMLFSYSFHQTNLLIVNLVTRSYFQCYRC